MIDRLVACETAICWWFLHRHILCSRWIENKKWMNTIQRRKKWLLIHHRYLSFSPHRFFLVCVSWSWPWFISSPTLFHVWFCVMLSVRVCFLSLVCICSVISSSCDVWQSHHSKFVYFSSKLQIILAFVFAHVYFTVTFAMNFGLQSDFGSRNQGDSIENLFYSIHFVASFDSSWFFIWY